MNTWRRYHSLLASSPVPMNTYSSAPEEHRNSSGVCVGVEYSSVEDSIDDATQHAHDRSIEWATTRHSRTTKPRTCSRHGSLAPRARPGGRVARPRRRDRPGGAGRGRVCVVRARVRLASANERWGPPSGRGPGPHRGDSISDSSLPRRVAGWFAGLQRLQGRKARIGCGGLRVRPMCAADLQLEDVMRNIAGFVRSSILESVVRKTGTPFLANY
jgi:hypothetical protein